MTRLTRRMRVASAVFGGLAAIALGLTPTLAGHLGTGQTGTTTFDVRATVPLSCSVATGTLNFGTYTGGSLATTTTTNVTCSDPTAGWEVEYDHGLNGTTCNTRQMASVGIIPRIFLPYTIHDGTLAGTQLGLLTDAPACVTQTGTGTASTTVAGAVGSGHTVVPADYIDQITVTLHF